jgi:hypothetical protein
MKLSEALSVVQRAPADASPLPVLLACGFTPLHLTNYLAAHLQTAVPRHRVQIETGLYDDLAGTLEQFDFGKPSFGKADAYRLQTIKRNQRVIESGENGDLAEQCLATAEASISLEFNPPATDKRVVELVNKTNQFNLNGISLQWRGMASRIAGSEFLRGGGGLSRQVWSVGKDCRFAW